VTKNKPTPNLIRFGVTNGSIGADLDSLFLGGEERYAEEGTLEIKITDENRSEIAAVLRELADFVERRGAPSGGSSEGSTNESPDDGPMGEERQV